MENNDCPGRNTLGVNVVKLSTIRSKHLILVGNRVLEIFLNMNDVYIRLQLRQMNARYTVQ